MAKNIKEATPEEVLAETQRAAELGRVPFEDTEALPVEEDPGNAEAFTFEDLTGTVQQAQSVRFPIPGTEKSVWVHPLTGADYKTLLQWALEGVDGPVRPKDQALSNEDSKVYQVILCCFTGPDRKNAKPCFRKQHLASVQHSLGYATINQIVAISERLSGSDEILSGGVRRFFTVTGKLLRISLSVLDTAENCPNGLTDTLTRFASLASRANTRGRLDAGMIEELGDY